MIPMARNDAGTTTSGYIDTTAERHMGLRFMEHVLILTHDPEGTRDWFCRNLGFREGYHPEFGFPVYWLYIGDQDVVHIGKANYSEHQDTYLKTPNDVNSVDYAAAGAPGSGRIDHVCFNCENIREFIERFERNGVEFNERKAHNSNLYQLFMRDPINGIKVELNFSAQEAIDAGRVASWTDLGANAGSDSPVSP
jgi:catechol 2,3-dioxygenase-like lactoylglutathione lyase family enzyme